MIVFNESTRLCFYKVLLFTSVFFIATHPIPGIAQKSEFITDQSISKRCTKLIQKREDKIRMKQKSQTLIFKGEKLYKMTPYSKKTLKNKLKRTISRLKKEKELLLMQITILEEDIIRRGCPGVYIK